VNDMPAKCETYGSTPDPVCPEESEPLKHFAIITARMHRILNKTIRKLQCGPIHNVIAALPNIDGDLCSTPQSLADAHY